MRGPAFQRYIGIDYSGAQTPDASLKGLRVYRALGAEVAQEVRPPPGPRRYWTRRGVCAWLLAELQGEGAAIVGVDHGLSFPWAYFERHGLAPDWPAFLDDFHRHWPTDAEACRVDDVREGRCGQGGARGGDARWRRLAEVRCRAKSVFHFDVQGSVAKSTHAGLPWVRHLRQQLGERLHCWPFDGWAMPPGCSVLAEAYPSFYRAECAAEPGMTPDQHDAFAIATWLQRADRDGRLLAAQHPALNPDEKRVAAVEGWVLGVG